MLPLLLLFSISCIVAELSDSSESNPSCLLQTDRQRHQIGASKAQETSNLEHSAGGKELHEHSIEAGPPDESLLADQSVALDEMAGTARKPSINEKYDLARASRMKYPPFDRSVPTQTTVAGAVWPFMTAYHVYWLLLLLLLIGLLAVCCCLALFIRRRQKRDGNQPGPRPILSAPANVQSQQQSQPQSQQQMEHLVLAYERECQAQQTLASQRQISLQGHDELRLVPRAGSPRNHKSEPQATTNYAPQTTSSPYEDPPPQVPIEIYANHHSEPQATTMYGPQTTASPYEDPSPQVPIEIYANLSRTPPLISPMTSVEVPPAGQVRTMQVYGRVPTATVAVDSTGDGRANYLYTGVDRDNDGIPDDLQQGFDPLVTHMQIPTATVAVDANGDGHVDYLYTDLDRNRDGIPDSLQAPQMRQSASPVGGYGMAAMPRAPLMRQQVQQEVVMDRGAVHSTFRGL